MGYILGLLGNKGLLYSGLILGECKRKWQLFFSDGLYWGYIIVGKKGICHIRFKGLGFPLHSLLEQKLTCKVAPSSMEHLPLPNTLETQVGFGV